MRECLRATWIALTWRKFLLMQALGQLAILIASTEDDLFGSWMGHPSLQYVSMALNVCIALPVALFADAAVDRGGKARVLYPLAIFMTIPIAGVSAATMQWVYLLVFKLPAGTVDIHVRSVMEATSGMFAYGAFVMLVYMNRRTADRMLEGIRRAELRHAQLENQLVNSRLATTEAQIDPERLFGALADVREAFNRSLPEAEAQLDRLVQSLRTTLARAAALNESDVSKS